MQDVKWAAGVNNRQCWTPVAVVLQLTPLSPCATTVCLSVCLLSCLHLSHIFFLPFLFYSHFITPLSPSLCLHNSFSLLCPACFTVCRLRSPPPLPGLTNCGAFTFFLLQHRNRNRLGTQKQMRLGTNAITRRPKIFRKRKRERWKNERSSGEVKNAVQHERKEEDKASNRLVSQCLFFKLLLWWQ